MIFYQICILYMKQKGDNLDGVKYYDWHNGIDFGCNEIHQIVKAIEGGEILIQH